MTDAIYDEDLRVPEPDEALSPREARLARAAGMLRLGALGSAVLVVIELVLVLLNGLGLALLPVMHTTLLPRYTGGDDVALAIVLLLALLNVSALLVVMIGVLAREVWGLVSIWLVMATNIGLLVWLGFTPAVLAIVPALLAGIITLRDPRAFRVNPVMLKELRGRMRGMRAFIVLTIYLGLMSGFMALLYLSYTSFTGRLSSAAAGAVGRLLFSGVVGVELLLIIFIAPAFTAGAITGERERQTYDLLRTTLLASPSFVIGKLESALGYILLLLLAAIPLQSIAFLFGGVSQTELLLAFVILAITAIALGTVGIYFSAVAPRTLSASVRTYTVTLVVTFVAPFILSLITGGIRDLYGGVSPVLEGTLIYLEQFFISVNPVQTALATQNLLIGSQQIGFSQVTLTSTGGTVPVVSPWISFTIVYLVTSTVLVVMAVREMRKVEA